MRPLSQEQHPFETISNFASLPTISNNLERLTATKYAAHHFREHMLAASKPVLFYQSIPLIRVPYPTRYGLLNAVPAFCGPFIHILNRMIVVQFKQGQQVKTLLISPSDIHGNAATPYFARLSKSMGPLEPLLKPLLAPEFNTVESALHKLGIDPAQIDYISYDHLHTQDVRKWLGTPNKPGYFPNAKLLVMAREWQEAQTLFGPQLDWYCPRGIEGIDLQRVVRLDQDVMLGDGVALIQTPGHTLGNHSFVVHTDEGLMVTSENGICADSYAPLHSRINSVRRYAQSSGMEVIMNGNTLEMGNEQYFSMILERDIAGASKRNSDFYNFVPSSEFTSYWAFPGVSPSFTFGDLTFGQHQK